MISKNLHRYVLNLGKNAKSIDPDRYANDLSLCLALISDLDDFYCFEKRDPELGKQLKKLGAKLVLATYRQVEKNDLRDRVWATLAQKKISKIDGLITHTMRKKYPQGTETKETLLNLIKDSRIERAELLYIYSRLLGNQLTLDTLMNGPPSRQTGGGVTGGGVRKELPASLVSFVQTPPIQQTSTGVYYQFSYRGQLLSPGERWLFKIPSEYCGYLLGEVYVLHRKPIEDKSAMLSVRQDPTKPLQYHDEEGAYIKVIARHTPTDVFKEHSGLKFAEPRAVDEPEGETFSDWGIVADAIELVNAGAGRSAISHIHEIQVQMLPIKQFTGVQEYIFTPGTKFPNLQENLLVKKGVYQCGGGLEANLDPQTITVQGYYPGALKIGLSRTSFPVGRKDSTVKVNSYGQLIVKLREGEIFGFLEVIAGDLELKSDGKGSLSNGGWLRGRLSTDPSGEYFLPARPVKNARGVQVRMGGPLQMGHTVLPEEELILESRREETIYILGLRIWYL